MSCLRKNLHVRLLDTVILRIRDGKAEAEFFTMSLLLIRPLVRHTSGCESVASERNPLSTT